MSKKREATRSKTQSVSEDTLESEEASYDEAATGERESLNK